MAIDLQEGRSFRRVGGGRNEPPPRRRELEEDRYWQRSRPDRRPSPSRRSRSRPRAASPPRRRREHEERGRERGAARRPSGPRRDDQPRDSSLGRRRASRSHASGSRRGSSCQKDKPEDPPIAAAEAPAATSPTKEEAKKEPDAQKLDISRRDGFSVGQRVKARYLSGSFYTATIEGFLAEGKVLLQWADGDANDRKKSPEELVPCDASGHPLGSAAEAAARRDVKETETVKVVAQAPPPAPPKQAELTPAERAQAERIREFQRRQGGEPKAAAQPAPAAAPAAQKESITAPQEPEAGELPAAERQKLEERLQVLRVQYFRLHEQISADTASTEKEMQELVQSGAGEKELMNFRSERLSLQSGQRLAALQISKQISEVEQKLNPDRGLRSEPETNGTKAKEPAGGSQSPQPSLQELWGSG